MDLKITPSGQTIVKPTALGPGANTDTKLLIYGLFQKGRVLAQDGEPESPAATSPSQAHDPKKKIGQKQEHVRGIREKIARVIFERRTPGRQATAATKAHWFAASERFEETIRLRLFKQLIRDPNECGATGG